MEALLTIMLSFVGTYGPFALGWVLFLLAHFRNIKIMNEMKDREDRIVEMNKQREDKLIEVIQSNTQAMTILSTRIEYLHKS